MSHRTGLLVAAGLLVSFVLLLFGPLTSLVNSFVGTEAMRHEIEAKASQAAGGSVTISQIRFGFIHGIQLTGLTSKIGRPEGTIVSQVESVNCSFSWPALLERRLQFDGVTLVRPQIVLTQEPASSVPQPPSPPPAATPGGSERKAPASSFLLESARILDGRLSIRDAAGVTKADLQEVTVQADTSGYEARKEVSGKLVIATIALPQSLSLTDFTTPFIYQDGSITADPLQAAAFGGSITGSYQLVADGSPSALIVNGTGFDLGKIAQMAKPGAASPLSGALSLQSRWQGVETGRLAGEGDAQIVHGRLSGIGALHEIAGVLGIPALGDPELTSVKVHFQVRDGFTRFSGLEIESPIFSISGGGTIDPQGGLNADLNLTLHGDAVGGLTGLAAALVSRAGSIPLHLSGTVSDPHTNLSARILNPAPKVQHAVDRAITHLFH